MLGIFRAGRLAGDALRRYRTLSLLGVMSIISVDLLDVALPLILKGIIEAIEQGDSLLLPRICAVYLLISFFQAILRILWRVGFFQLGTRMARDTRERILESLFRLPLIFFGRRQTGDLVSLAQSDTEAVRHVLESGMITIFDGILYIIAIPLVMIWLSPKLALLSLVLVPLMPLIVRANEKKLKIAAREQQDSIATLSNRAHESFSTVRVIKSFAKEDRFIERFSEASRTVADRSVALARREAFFSPQIEGIISVATTVMLFIGSSMITNDEITIGTFVAFQRYLQQLLWPTQAVGIWFSQVQRAAASSERIERVLHEPPDKADISSGAVRGETNLPIRVSKLNFSYDSHDTPLLRDISFFIENGERVALVGPSGCGKSTLLQLLLRARQADSGVIELYGADYRGLTVEDIRTHVAFVEQAPFLFSDSIRANISPTADSKKIAAVLSRAALDGEIDSMPAKIESIIGERGVTLSGGQRQRVAIARSFARDGTVLLWDNALSSVDLVTESRILEQIERLPRTSSALLVTHRLSTALRMDRILVLRNGVIEQNGTHDQLIRQGSGWYSAFCEHQKTLSAIEALEQEVRGDA